MAFTIRIEDVPVVAENNSTPRAKTPSSINSATLSGAASAASRVLSEDAGSQTPERSPRMGRRTLEAPISVVSKEIDQQNPAPMPRLAGRERRPSSVPEYVPDFGPNRLRREALVAGIPSLDFRRLTEL